MQHAKARAAQHSAPASDPVFDYWNNVEMEKTKPYWVEEERGESLHDYLRRQTNLERGFEDALAFAAKLGPLGGACLEIGAGTGWTTARLSGLPVETITAVDFSRHRIEVLAPRVLRLMGGNPAKVRFVSADIFALELPPGEFNAVVLNQAFYMFSPLQRLAEMLFAWLKPGGVAIISCDIFCQDPPRPPVRDASGRYSYAHQDYREALEAAGFAVQVQGLGYQFYPSLEGMLPSVNFFGVKP